MREGRAQRGKHFIYRTAPVLPGVDYSVLRDFIELVALLIEHLLGLCWWDVLEGLQQAAIVEPVDTYFRVSHSSASAVFHGQTVNDLRFE